MKTVKLTLPLLIGDTHYKTDAVVLVTDEQALTMTRAGHAEIHDGNGEIANPDCNPLAEAITPYPPGGAVVNPADALAPNVTDNPGQLALAAAAKGATVKSAKVQGDAIPTRTPPKVGEDVTANEVTVKAETVKVAPPTGKVN